MAIKMAIDVRGRSDGWFNFCHRPVTRVTDLCNKPIWVSAVRSNKHFEADPKTHEPTDVPHVCRAA